MVASYPLSASQLVCPPVSLLSPFSTWRIGHNCLWFGSRCAPCCGVPVFGHTLAKWPFLPQLRHDLSLNLHSAILCPGDRSTAITARIWLPGLLLLPFPTSNLVYGVLLTGSLWSRSGMASSRGSHVP